MPKSTEYAAKVADDRGFIAYDAKEDAVWRDLMAQQLPAVRARMASPYLRGLDLLDLPQDRVPQCPDVSAKLGALTGWRVEPVPALIGFGRFWHAGRPDVPGRQLHPQAQAFQLYRRAGHLPRSSATRPC